MKILYLDCFAGISGDMFVAALLDLGVQAEALTGELRKLPVDGYQVRVGRTSRCGVGAMRFEVFLEGQGEAQLADGEYHEVDSPVHLETPEGQPPGAHTPHRHLSEILSLLEHSSLSPAVRSRAQAIFRRLGEAEARVHGVPVDEVHFHEVGGVDAIVDIVSAALCLELLGVDQIHASPLHLGGGFVRSAHGLLPVPAPATAGLLVGIPAYTSEVRGELVTPTGAAIVSTLAQRFGPLPLLRVQAVGYGAGKRERDFPNVLRAYLGETLEKAPPRASREPYPEQAGLPVGPSGYHQGEAVMLEANLDDMNPQFYERLVERLLDGGALDVTLLPVQMKKGRPGVLLQTLALPGGVQHLLPVIFSESTSLGVRSYPVTRHMLPREMRTVQTPYGAVRVKIARLGEQIVNAAPEYEDCRALAIQHGLAVKEVFQHVYAALGRKDASD